MSRTVKLLVQVPDEVYDNAVKVMEHTKTSVEAVLSVATQQEMESISDNVKEFVKLHGLGEEA